MSKSIHHKLFFSHPPAAVWEYLTKSELIAQWLMPNDFLPIVGYDFEFRIKPMPQVDFDGIVYNASKEAWLSEKIQGFFLKSFLSVAGKRLLKKEKLSAAIS